MAENSGKIKTIDEVMEQLKGENLRVTTTNGCFDLLHFGHIWFLNEAYKLGDIVIVFVASDEYTKVLKGNERPIVNEDERMYLLANLDSTGWIVRYNGELELLSFLEKVKPAVHVKSSEYLHKKLPEKEIIYANNGVLAFIPEVENYSTTNLINKIRGIK